MERGDPGERGEQGATGATGAQGLKGDPGHILIPKRTLRFLIGTAVVIVIELAALLAFVIPSFGTNHGQDNKIAALLSDQNASSYKGCVSNNNLRKQSNLRIPIESAELNTALEVAEVASKFNLPPVRGVTLDADKIREYKAELSEVPLRPCALEYHIKTTASKKAVKGE